MPSNEEPTQEDWDKLMDLLANEMVDLAEQAVKKLLSGMKDFHAFYLAYHTTQNHEPPNQTESREVAEVLLNRLAADLQEIETSIFPDLEGFLASDVNYRQMRKSLITSTTISHSELEGMMNAPNN